MPRDASINRGYIVFVSFAKIFVFVWPRERKIAMYSAPFSYSFVLLICIGSACRMCGIFGHNFSGDNILPLVPKRIFPSLM